MKAGKVWGETQLLHANGVLEFHRIEVDEGGCCSKHKHKYKWNGFFVEEGCLTIRVWQDDYDLVDKTNLYAGDFMQVKPGLYHSFEAPERTIAFELYWAEFDHNDIDRESVGERKDYAKELLEKVEKKLEEEHPMGVCGRPGCTNHTGLQRNDDGMVRCGFHSEDLE